MHETFKMLGQERQAELEREALRIRLAAALPPNRRMVRRLKDGARRALFGLVRMPRAVSLTRLPAGGEER